VLDDPTPRSVGEAGFITIACLIDQNLGWATPPEIFKPMSRLWLLVQVRVRVPGGMIWHCQFRISRGG